MIDAPRGRAHRHRLATATRHRSDQVRAPRPRGEELQK